MSGKTGQRYVPVTDWVWEAVKLVMPWLWTSRDAAGMAVRRAFKLAGFQGRRASAQTIRHTFVRLWRGEETAPVGTLGWTSPRMLARYRPFDVDRAKEQHAHHNPLNLAELELGATQPRLL